MEPRTLQYLSEACAGECRGPADLLVRRVCTDSRQARPGDLFVALSGPRFDGHDFIAAALGAGAAAVLAARRRSASVPAGAAAVLVEDTRAALGQLAWRYRRDFDPLMIAVAGSHGKTTTKELAAAVLRQAMPVLWSEASFNNEIGVPMTLLRLERSHRAAVVELGTNHPGELAPLVRLCAPRLGLLTALGREHLEFFGTLEAVAAEEGWLAELLPAGGRLFVLGDDPLAAQASRRSVAPVTRVGFGPGNDWRAEELRMDEGGVTFRVRAPRADYSGEYRLNLLGRHQVLNALLALALGAEAGVGRAAAARGLAECRPAKMRLELWETRGVRVLDDAYNANADSTAAALETLAALPCAGRRWAVLGEMAELGAHTVAAHQEAGRRAAELGVDGVLAVGRHAPITAAAARAGGVAEVEVCEDAEAAAAVLLERLQKGDLVLLKASRAARLERVAEYLRAGRAPERKATPAA